MKCLYLCLFLIPAAPLPSRDISIDITSSYVLQNKYFYILFALKNTGPKSEYIFRFPAISKGICPNSFSEVLLFDNANNRIYATCPVTDYVLSYNDMFVKFKKNKDITTKCKIDTAALFQYNHSDAIEKVSFRKIKFYKLKYKASTDNRKNAVCEFESEMFIVKFWSVFNSLIIYF